MSFTSSYDSQQDIPDSHLHDEPFLETPILQSTHRDTNEIRLRPNTDDINSKKDQRARAIIFIACLSLLVAGRAAVPNNMVPCIIDYVQNWLGGINAFISNNSGWRDALQIIFSISLDSIFLITAANWILRGTSSRLIVAGMILYAFRVILQLIWSTYIPEGYQWFDPGFPSLVVSYGKQKDFFYSGYAAFVTLCGNEWRKNGNKFMTTIITLAGIYTCFILLVFRKNYSVDLFAGVTFAHYIFILVDENKNSIDNFFLRIQGSVTGKRFVKA